MSADSTFEFDFQTAPQDSVIRVNRLLHEETEKLVRGKARDLVSEERIKLIGTLGINLEANKMAADSEAEMVAATAFIVEQIRLMHSLISTGSDHLKGLEGQIFVARALLPGKVVGFFNGMFEGDQAQIVDYFIRAEMRRRGIAKSLHQFVTGELQRKGVRRITTIMDNEKISGLQLLRSQGYKAAETGEDNVDYYLDL